MPEIQRADLTGAILQVLCWIEPDLAAFPWFESPAANAVGTLILVMTIGATLIALWLTRYRG